MIGHMVLALLLCVCFIDLTASTSIVDHQAFVADKVIPLLTKLEEDTSIPLALGLTRLNLSYKSRFPQGLIDDIKNDECLSDIDKMFDSLVITADEIWDNKTIDYMDFFRFWLRLADRVNLLSTIFKRFSVEELENYKRICVKEFQAIQATSELISKTKYVDPSIAVSTPEDPKPWQELVITFPLQSLWLDLAQDAMAKYVASKGVDPDGVVKEILDTASNLRKNMPKAIPRNHLYQLTDAEQNAYREVMSDATCAICLERTGKKLGERLHCEYMCGKVFHTACVLDYVRKTKKGLAAVCAYRCRWPVLEVPRKQGITQWLKMTYQFILAIVNLDKQTQ